jgi:hypothetical protein
MEKVFASRPLPLCESCEKPFVPSFKHYGRQKCCSKKCQLSIYGSTESFKHQRHLTYLRWKEKNPESYSRNAKRRNLRSKVGTVALNMIKETGFDIVAFIREQEKTNV